jgi:type III restriction enzyme
LLSGKSWRKKKVPADEIAIYTDTRVVPDEAEKISSLSALRSDHRHIIFNQALQEGWDDPNAYVCYFDDQTKSYTRIQQIIGRILRQPNARRYSSADLNKAVILIRSTNEQFEAIIEHLKRELRLYADDPDDPGSPSAIRVTTRKETAKSIRVKPKYKRKRLRNLVLGDVDLSAVLKQVEATGKRPWAENDLAAPGARKTRVVSLKGAPDKKRYEEIRENARVSNRLYFKARVLELSRPCHNLIDPQLLAGPAFDQLSCPHSTAQTELQKLARDVVEEYEARVDFEGNDLPGEKHWKISDITTSATALIPFNRAAHSRYPRSTFNKPELEFAEGLDSMTVGVWCRNPANKETGFGIPLPVKIGSSSTFYPDFLWWFGERCFAIDPTGRHILEDKVRAKLLSLDSPRIILATPGQIAKDWTRAEDKAGWTMVRPRVGRPPAPEYFQTVPELLTALRK